MTNASFGNKIWEDRKYAVLESIRLTYERLYKETDPPYNKQVILHMLNRLGVFTDELFKTFFEGFQKDDTDPNKLPISDIYPCEYVFGKILEQAAYDMGLMEQIWNTSKQFPKPSLTQEDLSDTLLRAKWLGEQALEPAQLGLGVPANTFVLPTFQYTTRIRTPPYTNVGLISIPYTALLLEDDDRKHNLNALLAIPHEAGHVVYWSGNTSEMTNEVVPFWHSFRRGINGRMKFDEPKRALAFRWLEEIFCDVYGTLVAGASIAYKAQDVALMHSRKQFEDGTGAHPTPSIRPFIYSKVLALMPNQSEWADDVHSLWVTRRNARSPEQDGCLSTIIDHDSIDLNSDKLVDFVIRECFEFLRDTVQDDAFKGDFWKQIRNLQPPEPSKDPEQYLINEFAQRALDKLPTDSQFISEDKPIQSYIKRIIELGLLFDDEEIHWHQAFEYLSQGDKGPHGRHFI